jgi:hypothetical protein
MTMLVSRLRYLAARNASAGTDGQKIVAPLIGTGMPRAGTTFFHGLIAQDPANRAVTAWEAAIPAPLDAVNREELYSAILGFQGMTAPDVTEIHPFGAAMPEECIFLQETACMSLYSVYWNVPAFQAAVSGKSTEALAWQIGLKQFLQAGAPDRRWALKGPGHLYAWDEMLIAFPDAKIYVNHRDPGKVIPSIASLFAKLRSLFSDAEIDHFELGQAQMAGWQAAVEGYTRWRDGPGAAAQVSDVRFTELIADPLATVDRVYGELDIPLSREARDAGFLGALYFPPPRPPRDAMARHLERDHHASAPKRPYTLAEYGLDVGKIEGAFAPYIERFKIQREKRA